MQQLIVSKSKFKAKALEYFRMVQTTGNPVLVSHNEDPVIQVSLYNPTNSQKDLFKKLSNAITYLGDIESPVGVNDWKVIK